MTSPVVIITGASRGIGAASAKLFAENGYAVCVNYLSNHDAATKVVNEIRESGGIAIAVQADVCNENDVERLFKTVDDELGQLTVLVNNAAILQPQMRFEMMSLERIERTLIKNIASTMLCSQQAIKRMSTRYNGTGGCIVNVSSGASRTGSPNEYIDYAASKGAIDTFTKGLALEVAAEGIRVNCVRPGLIYTDMHADGGEAQRVDRLKSKLPLQRGGLPSEVAEAIYWSASDKSSFSTANFIDVSGGL